MAVSHRPAVPILPLPPSLVDIQTSSVVVAYRSCLRGRARARRSSSTLLILPDGRLTPWTRPLPPPPCRAISIAVSRHGNRTASSASSYQIRFRRRRPPPTMGEICRSVYRLPARPAAHRGVRR